MNSYLVALIIGMVIGVLSANPKFLTPYILGFSLALVIVTVGKWLV